MTLEWNGDKLLQRMQTAMDQATGDVKLTDLMHSAFMLKHTRFDSLNAMLTASQLTSDSTRAEELAVILKGQAWNQFVAANSDFASWQEMMSAAARERVKAAFDR